MGDFSLDPVTFGVSDSSASWQSGLLGLAGSALGGYFQLETAKATQQPKLYTDQRLVYPDATTRAVSAAGGLRLGDLLPFLLVGVGVLVLMRD